jgi:hypothetical protein
MYFSLKSTLSGVSLLSAEQGYQFRLFSIVVFVDEAELSNLTKPLRVPGIF